MNGEIPKRTIEDAAQDVSTQPTESFLGVIALRDVQEPISDNPAERVEQAKALIAEIRNVCETDLAFHELIIKGVSNRDDDNEPDIKLVWGGRPFPIYEHNRIATYIDADGNENSLLISIEAMGSYALRADELPKTNADTNKEQVKLRKFKKNIQKKQLWGMNVSIAALKDTLDPENDKVVNSSDGTQEYIADAKNQEVFTVSFRNSGDQSIFRTIDPEDLAQLQQLAELIKRSSYL
jgi:hypothetical protein